MLKFGVAVPPGKLLLVIGIVVTQRTPSILFSLDAKPFPRQQLYSLVKCDDGAFARKGEGTEVALIEGDVAPCLRKGVLELAVVAPTGVVDALKGFVRFFGL